MYNQYLINRDIKIDEQYVLLEKCKRLRYFDLKINHNLRLIANNYMNKIPIDDNLYKLLDSLTYEKNQINLWWKPSLSNKISLPNKNIDFLNNKYILLFEYDKSRRIGFFENRFKQDLLELFKKYINSTKNEQNQFSQEKEFLIQLLLFQKRRADFQFKEIMANRQVLPNTDTEVCCNVNFGNKKHNNLFCKEVFLTNKTNHIFNFIDVPKDDKKKEILTNQKELSTYIKKINDNYQMTSMKKQHNINSKTAKINKKIKYINHITVTRSKQIYPTNEQKKILSVWFDECTKVYNKCVDEFNKDSKKFNTNYKKTKLKIFDLLYKKQKKPAPYDSLGDEVRAFCDGVNDNYEKLKKKQITHFEMKHKNVTKKQSIFIRKDCINMIGIYSILLKGKMKGMNFDFLENVYFDEIEKIKKETKKEEIKKKIFDFLHDKIGDSRLLYDKMDNKYFIKIPIKKKKYEDRIRKFNNEPKKEPIVAIDPGEKIFASYYGLKSYGYIGKDIRDKILKEEGKIRKRQRIISKKVNKKGKKIKSSGIKKLRKKIRKCYKKIKDIVKELHNKTALFLCKKYDRILLPKFETQEMVKNKKYDKVYFNNIKETIGQEECKKQIKYVTKKRRLNGRVKFVLNMLSHYSFKLHIKNKALEYGSQVIDVTEEHTSLTCTACGTISNKYKGRTKECECGEKIDRDINGSRNILIKNITSLLEQ